MACILVQCSSEEVGPSVNAISHPVGRLRCLKVRERWFGAVYELVEATVSSTAPLQHQSPPKRSWECMHLGIAVTSMVHGGQNGSRWLWRILWPPQACRRRQITLYTHFESPQTAHAERNGMHFSAVLLRGGWAFPSVISHPVGRLR